MSPLMKTTIFDEASRIEVEFLMEFEVLRSGYAWVCPCASKMKDNDNRLQ